MLKMYGLRVPKKEKPSEEAYEVYNPHHGEVSLPLGKIRVISIDPGTKNLAIRVDVRETHGSSVVKMEVYEKLSLDDHFPFRLRQIYDFFDSHPELFLNANLLLIERQMPQNYQMVRISEHIISYFYKIWMDLPHHPLIIEVNPQMKGKVLGFDRRRDFDLKEWSPIKAVEILTFHGDLESIALLGSAKKKDDLADVVCQEEAVMLTLYP